MLLKNGRSEISVSGEAKGGGWYEFNVVINGKPNDPKKIQGLGAANEYLVNALDVAFKQGYRLVNDKGRMITAPRLDPNTVATLAEAISQGADPGSVAKAVEEVRGEALRPAERQALIACAVKTRERFSVEGVVNQRWANGIPAFDQALLARLVVPA